MSWTTIPLGSMSTRSTTTWPTSRTGPRGGRARPWSGWSTRRRGWSGCYLEGRQVGFARAFSDGVALAYLADVYILPEHQGRGLGVELVREMVENGPLTEVKWILHTRDAHDLYRRFGFGEPSERVLERRPG